MTKRMTFFEALRTPLFAPRQQIPLWTCKPRADSDDYEPVELSIDYDNGYGVQALQMGDLRHYKSPVGLPVVNQYLPLTDTAHVLIAGTTGAGKSVCLNGIIYTILGTRTPSQAQLILIDPKRVELSPYKKLPHTASYTTEAPEANILLQNAIDIINNRYTILSAQNSKCWTAGKVYIIIDELADLLIAPTGRQTKPLLQRILQIGRAAGVSVIACTQAPNRSIIPANLTLNFTDRIALRCISAIESRQIIQASGAEALPRYGKGLYLSPEGLQTIEMPFLRDEELQERINYWMDI